MNQHATPTICVVIGRGRHRLVIKEHHHLVEQGAKLVELRLDYIEGQVNLKRLVTDRPCPVVISCRRPSDGGKWTGTEQQRQLLLRTAITEGVEYIDIEDDIAPSIPRFGKTKRIISHHNFRTMPDNLEELHRRLAGMDPDLIKISCMANHTHDNLKMLELVRKSQVPTIGLCMGDIGIPSRLLNGRAGSPFTYATIYEERVLAPGQLTFQQMTQIYRYEQINDQTEIYGVIADPVGHSLSPLIHNVAFAHFGLNKVYIPFRVPREDLAQFVADAPAMGIRGLSVTIPHKETILPMLTAAEDAAEGIGAVNTVVFDGDTRTGYNTDYRAAMSALEAAMGISEKCDTPLQGKTALVLGAGGAGLAITFGLVRRGATVVITDGAPVKAAALAQRFGCRVVDWSQRHGVLADILVNCTPVGMHPNVDETPFDKHHLKPSTVVFDVVYNPENTLLIKDARSRNCTVVTGVEMFVRQACLQFKLFTGRDGPADLMRDVIRRTIGAAKL